MTDLVAHMLSVQLGRCTVLHGVSLRLEPGELVLAVTNESCGKQVEDLKGGIFASESS